jgi:predicted small secreted protein
MNETGGERRDGHRARRMALAAAGLLVVALVLAACGTNRQDATSAGVGATQRSEGGQVTVAVTWGGREAGPVFRVVMDTHAVDLDGYDLRQLTVLRAGGREVRPSGWDAPKGGHHREGTLTFPATLADGSPTIGPAAGAVEIVIRDVAGVPERTFRWMP